MVLKNFLHYLINKYLKNYIERVDYEKVKLNLNSGNIFLENVRLKPDALAYMNIPVTVAVGYLEQLKVIIPWNNFSTKSTEVHIDGLYLLIVPKNEMSQDLSQHYVDKHKRVEQKLDNLRKATLGNGTFDNKNMAFVERMIIQVMQNVILKIRNLHISYKMESPTKLGHPFSFGVTLHYLEIVTTTDIKQTKQIKGNTLLNYRIKEINSLSFYWNTKCKSQSDILFKDILDELKSKIATNNYTVNDIEMKYILRPINLVTKSLITLKPKNHYYERSRLIFDIQIPEINLYIDFEQISDILDFIKFQNYTTTYDRCREYHNLLLRDSSGIEKLTQKQRIQFLESKLDIFHLAYIRHKVEIERNNTVQEQQLEINRTQVNTENNHSRWNSWSKLKNSLNNLKNNHRTLPHIQNERKLVFEDLPKIDIEINFNKLNLNLLSPIINQSNNDIIVCISIYNARIDMKKMCVTSRIECLIELESVQVFGMERDKDFRPILLMPILSLSSPVVHAKFELFSANQKSDYSLQLIIEPIRIIYDAPTINQLVECFEANGPVIWQSEQEVTRQTTIEMGRNLSYEKIFDLTINLKGGSILLPKYGIYQQDCSMIRINFGNIILKSCQEEIDSDIDRSLFKKKINEQRSYIKYKFELGDLRIVYLESNKKRLHILRRTPLIDINFYKCIYSDDTNLPNWLIGVKIAMGDIQLSKTILTKLILHLQSIPLLYSNIMIIIKRINFYFTLFSPNIILVADFSIYHCCLRLLIQPQTSIRADFHIYTTRTRDEICTDTYVTVELNELTMMQHIFSQNKKSSRLFYRNEHIQLTYSDTKTKL